MAAENASRAERNQNRDPEEISAMGRPTTAGKKMTLENVKEGDTIYRPRIVMDGPRIDAHLVERAMPKTLLIRGRYGGTRIKRDQSMHQPKFFATFAEAKDRLIEIVGRQESAAIADLDRAKANKMKAHAITIANVKEGI